MEKELIALEYDKVLHALSEHAVSECGRQFCLQLRPLSTAEQAREALAQTDCADRLLLRFGVPSLSAVFIWKDGAMRKYHPDEFCTCCAFGNGFPSV